MDSSGQTLPLGARIAGELAQGVPQRITVNGVVVEGRIDAHTGLLDPASHLQVENLIKDAFKAEEIPHVVRGETEG